MTIRLLIVDDHRLVRDGLMKLLQSVSGFEVVGEAGDGFEAVDKAAKLAPCIVLMDISLPGLSGLEATRLIKRDLPSVEVIALSASESEDDILGAVRAGAKGYILKDANPSAVFSQIRQVAAGGVALSEEMAAKLVAGLYQRPAPLTQNGEGPYAPLTERELKVLELVAQGMANKEIAGILCISENTARAHVRSLMQKLGVDNRTQLAVYSIRQGIGWRNGKEAPAPRTLNGANGHEQARAKTAMPQRIAS